MISNTSEHYYCWRVTGCKSPYVHDHREIGQEIIIVLIQHQQNLAVTVVRRCLEENLWNNEHPRYVFNL